MRLLIVAMLVVGLNLSWWWMAAAVVFVVLGCVGSLILAAAK